MNGLILTAPQWRELDLLNREAQTTYGSSRARVQRTLVRMGLAEFVEKDGSPSSSPEIADYCRITEAGHAARIVTRALKPLKDVR